MDRDTILTEVYTGRRGRLRAYVFEIATALAYPALGVAYFLDPGRVERHSIQAQAIHPYDTIWYTLYIVGGFILFLGVLRPSLRARAVGLLVLATGLAMQVVAVLSVQPDLRVLFNSIYFAACLSRVYLIARLMSDVKAEGRQIRESSADGI